MTKTIISWFFLDHRRWKCYMVARKTFKPKDVAFEFINGCNEVEIDIMYLKHLE